jgi:hypothetical protein
MADAVLTEPFDLVVLGTSLRLSLVAAAAARAGRRVAHLDANDFYGARDAALPLPQLRELLSGGADAGGAEQPDAPADAPEPGERDEPAPPERAPLHSVSLPLPYLLVQPPLFVWQFLVFHSRVVL